MADLKYYTEERERWPQLRGFPPINKRVSQEWTKPGAGEPGWCTREEATLAIPRLIRHFHVDLREGFTFTQGWIHPKAWYWAVRLNVDFLNWLTVAHELAHCWVAQTRKRPGEIAHGRRHARLTDRMCRYIIKMGWDTGGLAHVLALKEVSKATKETQAACPPPVDARIAQRRAQIKRLETKIKGLTTRLRKAQRSLFGPWNGLQPSSPDNRTGGNREPPLES